MAKSGNTHYVSWISMVHMRDRARWRGVSYRRHRRFRHRFEPIMRLAQPKDRRGRAGRWGAVPKR